MGVGYISSFVRPAELLASYLFPVSHWAQFALPEVFLGARSGWPKPTGNSIEQRLAKLRDGGNRAAILAGVGCVGAATSGYRALAPWRLIVPVAFALATMAEWWPDAFYLILEIPGLGSVPGLAPRYTVITSLGSALFAGRGLDHTISARCFWTGLTLMICFGAAAWLWSIHCARERRSGPGWSQPTLNVRFFVAGAFCGGAVCDRVLAAKPCRGMAANRG